MIQTANIQSGEKRDSFLSQNLRCGTEYQSSKKIIHSLEFIIVKAIIIQDKTRVVYIKFSQLFRPLLQNYFNE